MACLTWFRSSAGKRFRSSGEKLKDVYPDDDMREEIEKGCYIDGVLYDRIRVKDEYWHYAEVEEAARDCTHTCIDVARGLSTILRGRAPLKES